MVFVQLYFVNCIYDRVCQCVCVSGCAHARNC